MSPILALVCFAKSRVSEKTLKELCSLYPIVVWEQNREGFPWVHIISQDKKTSKLVEKALRAAHFSFQWLRYQPPPFPKMRIRIRSATPEYFSFDASLIGKRHRQPVLPFPYAGKDKYTEWGKVAIFVHNSAGAVIEALAAKGMEYVPYECCGAALSSA